MAKHEAGEEEKQMGWGLLILCSVVQKGLSNKVKFDDMIRSLTEWREEYWTEGRASTKPLMRSRPGKEGEQQSRLLQLQQKRGGK